MAEGLILKNKRKLDRHELIYYLPVTNVKDGQELGRLVDIHNEGLMMMGPLALEQNRLYHTCLTLPKALMKTSKMSSIEILCECMWSRPSPNDQLVDSGLKFIEPSDAEKRIITQLIEYFSMPS